MKKSNDDDNNCFSLRTTLASDEKNATTKYIFNKLNTSNDDFSLLLFLYSHFLFVLFSVLIIKIFLCGILINSNGEKLRKKAQTTTTLLNDAQLKYI